jgi:hypothetical protein
MYKNTTSIAVLGCKGTINFCNKQEIECVFCIFSYNTHIFSMLCCVMSARGKVVSQIKMH